MATYCECELPHDGNENTPCRNAAGLSDFMADGGRLTLCPACASQMTVYCHNNEIPFIHAPS